MTRFFVNEREIEIPLDLSSLDQILQHAENLHLPPNSVIRQINIDGLPLMLDFPQDSGEIFKQAENRDKVEIITGTLMEIAKDSIREAMAYLDRIEGLTPSLATGFQISPGPESFENLRQLYEGFYWMSLLLDKLSANFHISLESSFVQGLSIQDHLKKFISILKQLIDSQEKGDFFLISDLLEYEILPMVPIWKEVFSFISQRVHVAQ
jgi:hypothetical protein